MRMNVYVFLMMNLAVSSAASIGPTEPDVVDIGQEKSIIEVNMGADLQDDIIEHPNTQRSTIIDPTKLWTSPVPYALDRNLELNAKGVILKAFEQFRVKTCIDFKLRDSEDYYISVQKLNGCFSYIGRVQTNGQQLSIGRGCDTISIVEHEFLHALGFYHEQSRYDRDDYVTIVFSNILQGYENNFQKASSEESTTHGVPYDYWSVMHYGKNDFTNGNGSTIITKDPKFQDVIGQRMEMSNSDVTELNLLYQCNSSIAFMMYCGFSNGDMCQMSRCSQSGNGWQAVTRTLGGPSSDHTGLPSGKNPGQEGGYFMHASTASGQVGDSVRLETNMMSPKRGCNAQCLQFYYYNSGNESDQLNIWIREFQDEQDSTGTLRLVGHITGSPTSHWKLQHVSLNATKRFQVVFEVRKGSGRSSGGFSIDDINLSETECPHLAFQVDDFENLLNTSASGTTLYSPRQYSKEGYAYRIAVKLYKTYFGMFVQLLSGDNDNQLEWPCLRQQMNFQMLDQNPNIQLQMSNPKTFTTNENQLDSTGNSYWGNPREIGSPVFVDENNNQVYGGVIYGFGSFMNQEKMQYRNFLKGGSAIFLFDFQDLTPLVNGSALACPKTTVNISQPPMSMQDAGPCSSRITTTMPPPTTTHDRITTTMPPPTTTDGSIFGFSPAMVASPVLIVLLALVLLVP
ncbi:meprin A subunit beta-like isoform X2 [Melanotaenia boesemani]|uniref:meprin A subunit beta-like isoform X2 n=1 Tax=Melanotaenia boesemani TaxID=1250792 RepID=UPI001C03C36D|nr:meprin A subunit beta-like isoform X2 [Melanotaenia boesemani]